jgi:pyruvate dehydrogenase E2 component (dihydrolipoamide acetyltransferase)
MPSLGADMSSGKLVAWRKKAGDRIERGDIVADIDTDKATIEVESYVSGVLDRTLVAPGETVPVGTVMAVIREEGETEPVRAAGTPAAPPAPRVPISPAAAKLAAELNVDPATLRGTGPGGRITREDVAAARAATPEPAAPMDQKARLRQAIASAMSRSKREIPHYYLGTTIDLTAGLEWLAAENEGRPVADRLLYVVLLLGAVVRALREVPELNARWAEGGPVASETVHLGVAISLRSGGLVAPAIRHADRKSLSELMSDFRDLVRRARSGRLRSSEFTDPTITVTSLGERGVEAVYGVIYPPQVALVGFGTVVERPWVVQGEVVPRRVITATLSADHRASDGHRGGLFLSALDQILQQPSQL